MPANNKYATHEPHGGGRLPETEFTGPPIPRVTKQQIIAVEDWIMTHRDLNKPLLVTPWLFAIICQLYNDREYFPARRRLAEHMDCSVHTIDKAIAVGLKRKELEDVGWQHEEGTGNTQASLKRHRYIVPARSLVMAFNSATRKLSTG